MTCCVNDLYCAETVLREIATQHNIESPLIPRIATGLCSGILALNLLLGRDEKSQTVERNYAAVQELVEKFAAVHGSTLCTELLGCDLGTAEGQQQYREQQLGLRCNDLAISTIDMVGEILQTA